MIKLESRQKVLDAADELHKLGFTKLEIDDDPSDEFKEKMPDRSFVLMDDCTEAPGWTQDFAVMIVKGRDGKIVEVGWFGKQMAVY